MLLIQSVLLGFFVGFVYDVLRLSRQTCTVGRRGLFVVDLLFFGIATIATLLFIVAYNEGRLRWFVLASEGLGVWLYFQSLSPFVLAIGGFVLGFVRKVLGFIRRYFLLPLVRFAQKSGFLLRSQKSKITKMKTFFQKKCKIPKKSLEKTTTYGI